MNRTLWTRYLIAAALILLAGAVWALAEQVEMRVEVRTEDGQEITVDVNGVKETVYLDDLAVGEERSYDVGGHPVTIKRVGDSLTLVHEGAGMLPDKIHKLKGADCDMVWVTTEDVAADANKIVIMKHGDGDFDHADGNVMFFADGHPGVHDVMIMKGEDGEIDIEALKEKYGDDFEEFHTDDGHRVLKWVSEGGEGHPIMVKSGEHFVGAGMAHFRCCLLYTSPSPRDLN